MTCSNQSTETFLCLVTVASSPSKNTGKRGACAVKIEPDVGITRMHCARSSRLATTAGSWRGNLNRFMSVEIRKIKPAAMIYLRRRHCKYSIAAIRHASAVTAVICAECRMMKPGGIDRTNSSGDRPSKASSQVPISGLHCLISRSSLYKNLAVTGTTMLSSCC